MTLHLNNARSGKMFRRGLALTVVFTFLRIDTGLTLAKTPENAPTADLSRRVAKLSGARVDHALAEAARRHAQEIAKDTRTATWQRMKRAVEREGLADAILLPFSSVGTDGVALEAALFDFASRAAKARAPTHVGVARIANGSEQTLVAIFSRRAVDLAPLPARVDDRLTLRGRSTAKGLEALVFGPCRGPRCDGGVRRLPVQRKRDVIRVDVPADRRGWYVVELVADGPRGPEPAAVWWFASGKKAGKRPAARPRAGVDAKTAIDRARSTAELAPLEIDERLTEAATRHARAVCRAGVAAHVLPDGTDPSARARKAGYEGRVTENVAIARDAAEAHENFMWSPSHRENVLDPAATSVGLGIVKRKRSAGMTAGACVVQLFGYAGL